MTLAFVPWPATLSVRQFQVITRLYYTADQITHQLFDQRCYQERSAVHLGIEPDPFGPKI